MRDESSERIWRGNKVLLLLFLVCILLLLTMPQAYAKYGRQWNVLIIHSYHPTYPWTMSEEKGIESVFGRYPHTRLYLEYMDTKRVPFTEEYQKRLEDLYGFKYRGVRIDLVLVTDNNALTFAVRYHNRLFPGTPIVFCGVNNFDPSMLHGDPLVTGVPESDSTLDTLRLAMELQPQARQIYSIVDANTVTAQKNEEKIKEAAKRLGVLGKLVPLKARFLNEMLVQVRKIPADSIVIEGSSFFHDESGATISMQKAFEEISAACKAPIYSMWDFVLGHGIVGGKLLSGFAQGEAAGDMALQILKGRPLQEIPVLKRSPNRYMFDYRELERFGIPVSRLPKGSVVVNTPENFYARHKHLVWYTVFTLLILLLVIVLLVVNILKRRRVEERLRESETMFRGLVEQALVGVFLLSPDGRYLYVNQATADIVNYSPEEMVNKITMEDIIHPEDLPLVREKIRGLFEEERDADHVVFRVLKRDGSVRVLHGFGRRIEYGGGTAILGTVVDISEESARMREIELLRRAVVLLASSRSVEEATERVLPLIQEHTDADLVLLFPAKSGELELSFSHLYLNEQCVHLPLEPGKCPCGTAFAEGLPVLCRDIGSLEECSDGVCIRTGMRSFVALPLSRGERCLGVLSLGWKNEISLEPTRSFLDTLAGELSLGLEMIMLFERERLHARELEEQVKLRTEELSHKVAELERLTERLEVMNNELEAFTFSVSHDLRAPLRAMEGFADALKEDIGDELPELAREYADRIVASASRMDKLIEDLLRYSRISKQEIRLEAVDMDVVVEEVLQQLEAEIREREAKVEVKYPLGEVMGHRLLLEQVVANLLGNALKFVDKDVKPVVKVVSERVNGRLRIWFVDNGLGIEEKHRDRIFHIFERLHGVETYSGTGIGLAIVKRGIERMGGKVGVESTPGKGSRFWFELPVVSGWGRDV